MAFFAMVIVTLSQVSAVGFCEGSTEVFVGQHKVGGDSDCEHSSEDHLPTDCSEKPCEDNHVEIDLDVDDFARTSTEGEPTSPDFLPVTIVTFSPEKHLRPRKEISPLGFARPPPDLPVSLRFGVMRL
jgi:hypothetical protein